MANGGVLTIEECRKYLANLELTDKEVEELRDSLYSINEAIVNNYLELN